MHELLGSSSIYRSLCVSQENIFKFNYAYDRELRYSAVSKNMVVEHLNHTQPKSVADHVNKMVSANKKVFDAFNPSSKRLLIWQTKPSLH